MWKNLRTISIIWQKIVVDEIVQNLVKGWWKNVIVLHSLAESKKLTIDCGFLNTVQNPPKTHFFHNLFTLGIEAILDIIDFFANGDVEFNLAFNFGDWMHGGGMVTAPQFASDLWVAEMEFAA